MIWENILKCFTIYPPLINCKTREHPGVFHFMPASLILKNALAAVLFVAAIWLSGCESGSQSTAAAEPGLVTITDSIGRQIQLPRPVTKVVVANGYNLELINAVGAIDRVVGVDYGAFQDQGAYGKYFTRDQVIGQSTRELNYEKIIELSPQALIITGNGAWEDAERKLSPFNIKVIVLDAYYTWQFRENWALAGKIFGREEQAREMTEYFSGHLDYIQTQLKDVPGKTLYYEYKRIGNSTVPGDYFYNMVLFSGARNIFDDALNVEIDPEAVILRNPEYIVRVGTSNVSGSYAPPTPAEFARRREEIAGRPGWDEISAVKNGRILLLSHYSQGAAAKLVGTMYIAKYLYPEHLPELQPEEIFKTWLEKYQRLPYLEGHTVPAFPLDANSGDLSAAD